MGPKIRKNNGIISIATILLLCMFFLQSCLFNIGGCRLSNEDKQWLLDEDTLFYLYNGTDTIAVPVTTKFGQSEYEYTWGIPHGDNNHYGYTIIKFGISNDSITFRNLINACDDKIRIKTIKETDTDVIDVLSYYAYKDSITNTKFQILGKEYENCFYFSNPEDTVLQEFIFVKEYGVVTFKTYQNDLFELIP